MIFNQYAQYYDIFYHNKNYRRECNFLEALFKKYALHSTKTVLDLGCGTGNHLMELLKRGYSVTGIDASHEMLGLLGKKLKKEGLNNDLHQSFLESFKFKKKFDAIICMFSVINYVTKKSDLLKTIKNVSCHLKKDALFIFDFWNPEAVEGYYSPRRRKIFRKNNQVVERSSVTKINPQKKICEVSYICKVKDNGCLLKTFTERHVLRYHPINEIKDSLRVAGLQFLGFYPFLNLKGKIRKDTWDIVAIARKSVI